MVSVGWVKGIAVLGGCSIGLAGLFAQQAKVAPEVVSPGTGGIGRLVALPPAKTIDGRSFTLNSGAQATVIALTDLSCPLTRKFAPTLAAMEDKYRGKGVRFVFLNPNASESRAEILKEVKSLGLEGDYVWDS